MPLFRHRSAQVPPPSTTSTAPPDTTTSAGSGTGRSRSLFARRRRSSASSASSIHSDTHNPSQAGANSSHRKGLFNRDNKGSSRRSDQALIARDPGVIAAREKLTAAENAEKEADRALAASRRAVIEARNHCKQLEAQAIEEARIAKMKRAEAQGLGKQARGLGRHN